MPDAGGRGVIALVIVQEKIYALVVIYYIHLIFNAISGGIPMKNKSGSISEHFSRITEPRQSNKRYQFGDIISIA